jgi:hypothetical protein
MIRAQPTQSERPDDVTSIHHTLTGKVDRRGHSLEYDAGLGAALLLQLLGGKYVHRHCQLLGGGVPGS